MKPPKIIPVPFLIPFWATGQAIHPRVILVKKYQGAIPVGVVAHELVHVEQMKRFGYFPFLIRYFRNYFRFGYKNNPFEQEARSESLSISTWDKANELIKSQGFKSIWA